MPKIFYKRHWGSLKLFPFEIFAHKSATCPQSYHLLLALHRLSEREQNQHQNNSSLIPSSGHWRSQCFDSALLQRLKSTSPCPQQNSRPYSRRKVKLCP